MDIFDQKVADTLETLTRAATDFSPVAFASSLAAEDMVLTDMILGAGLPISIFTLNTGRLHAETLGMLDKIRDKWGATVAQYMPEPTAIAEYVARSGLNGFYESVDARKECCHIRKVEPLNRALAGKQAWVTGQRREQSTTRAELAVQEQDEARGIAKFNPLADWTEAEVWHYLKSRAVPYNPLHDKGYPSIGCEPCTRAIQPGEDLRAGRWWWENADSRECGLHLVDGKLISIKSAQPSTPA